MSDVSADAGTLDLLETLMNVAWPAPEAEKLDSWVLRSAGSVTQRANSVWPVSVAADPEALLRRTTDWYAVRRQPVIFQLTHRAENAALEELLDRHRYSRQSETLIMTAKAPTTSGALLPAGFTLTLSDTPSAEWLELWWRVDGRGGAPERHIAREILLGTPSLYASAIDGDGAVVGTGRVTLVAGWAGIYSMSVHPEFRRRGIAAALVDQLVTAAQGQGVSQLWLLVTAANTGAQELYSRAGFTELGGYHYRQAPLRRAPSAC